MALLLCLIVILAGISQATPKTLTSDVAALSAFKSSISPSSINPWSCVASWNFTSDPCRPDFPTHFTCGIVCTPDATRIVGITLDAAGYSATLNARALSPLTSLTHLDLYENNFYGAIPDLSPLRSLQTLVLTSNSFSGQIPVALSKLSSLQTLDLSRNSLTGKIPNLGSLSSLVSLDLSFNRLSGPLPDYLPPNLVTLAARGNLINGFLNKVTFQKLKWLETLELGANKLQGKLEGWFFLLPSLQQVDLVNNSLTSVEVWKPQAGSGDRLVAVDLSYNRILGALPAELAEYPALAALSARNNRLIGQIPWQYYAGKKGSAFRRLFLDGNFLNGKVPDEFLSEGALAGSFGDNCLRSCPGSSLMCSPVQKPDWVCKEVYGLDRRNRFHHRSPTPGRV